MEEDKISKKVASVELSGIRKFYNKVGKVHGAISLTLGQPDFPVPVKAKEAIINAVNSNKTGYTSNEGILELRDEISKFLKTQNINYSSDETCLTVGGSEGLMDVFTTFINPGDRVLVPNPAYPAYEACIKLVGGEIINYDLNMNDFSIDFEKLIHTIKCEKPKIIVISYPCNPTGAILSKGDRDRLYKILKDEDIIIVTDEMYSSLCFEDEYYSIAQCKELEEKTILVSGFSKMFSMTGLRIGYVCAPKKYIGSIVKVHQYNVSCAPSIAQYGALEGLKSCLKEADFMKNEFIMRRNYVYKRLKKMGFVVTLPKGAFYVFPSIDKFSQKSEEFCDRLLNKAKVAVVPGSAFGTGGEGHIRISYACNIEILKEAMDRIEAELKSDTIK